LVENECDHSGNVYDGSSHDIDDDGGSSDDDYGGDDDGDGVMMVMG